LTTVAIRRALISVYDKTGLADLARALHKCGVEIVSTGSTAAAITEAGVPVTRVADDRLGELLSIFPLTVAVQRIALEAAETLGVNPDTFGLDRPGHQGWDRLEL